MMKPKLIIAGITVRLISGDKRFSDSEEKKRLALKNGI